MFRRVPSCVLGSMLQDLLLLNVPALLFPECKHNDNVITAISALIERPIYHFAQIRRSQILKFRVLKFRRLKSIKVQCSLWSPSGPFRWHGSLVSFIVNTLTARHRSGPPSLSQSFAPAPPSLHLLWPTLKQLRPLLRLHAQLRLLYFSFGVTPSRVSRCCRRGGKQLAPRSHVSG